MSCVPEKDVKSCLELDQRTLRGGTVRDYERLPSHVRAFRAAVLGLLAGILQGGMGASGATEEVIRKSEQRAPHRLQYAIVPASTISTNDGSRRAAEVPALA